MKTKNKIVKTNPNWYANLMSWFYSLPWIIELEFRWQKRLLKDQIRTMKKNLKNINWIAVLGIALFASVIFAIVWGVATGNPWL